MLERSLLRRNGGDTEDNGSRTVSVPDAAARYGTPARAEADPGREPREMADSLPDWDLMPPATILRRPRS